MTYKIHFIGRKNGAIGITYHNYVTVEAETPEAAILKLYDTYEHIRVIKIE
jgi:hypothetical protein